MPWNKRPSILSIPFPSTHASTPAGYCLHSKKISGNRKVSGDLFFVQNSNQTHKGFRLSKNPCCVRGPFALPLINPQKTATCAAFFAPLKGPVWPIGRFQRPIGCMQTLAKTRKSGFRHFFDTLRPTEGYPTGSASGRCPFFWRSHRVWRRWQCPRCPHRRCRNRQTDPRSGAPERH